MPQEAVTSQGVKLRNTDLKPNNLSFDPHSMRFEGKNLDFFSKNLQFVHCNKQFVKSSIITSFKAHCLRKKAAPFSVGGGALLISGAPYFLRVVVSKLVSLKMKRSSSHGNNAILVPKAF